MLRETDVSPFKDRLSDPRFGVAIGSGFSGELPSMRLAEPLHLPRGQGRSVEHLALVELAFEKNLRFVLVARDEIEVEGLYVVRRYRDGSGANTGSN